MFSVLFFLILISIIPAASRKNKPLRPGNDFPCKSPCSAVSLSYFSHISRRDIMHVYTWYQWLIFFYLYCFFGWIFESSYVSILKRRFVNRGFLRIPMLPLPVRSRAASNPRPGPPDVPTKNMVMIAMRVGNGPPGEGQTLRGGRG